ncbi:MAG TPA: hypothetical protein VIJ95_00310 [Hanamia sp.]
MERRGCWRGCQQQQGFHFYQKELVLIKEHWGISVSAIFSRAKQLGIINDYVYRKFNIGFKKRGFHIADKEPGRYLGKEKPVRFERLIYPGLAKEMISINDAAFFSEKPPGEFRKQLQQFI